jgi:hypothetical protein
MRTKSESADECFSAFPTHQGTGSSLREPAAASAGSRGPGPINAWDSGVSRSIFRSCSKGFGGNHVRHPDHAVFDRRYCGKVGCAKEALR